MFGHFNQKSVVWAVDPFQTDVKPDRAAVDVLCEWMKWDNTEIAPAIALSIPSQAIEYMTPPERSDFLFKLQTRARLFFSSIGVSEIRQPKVLMIDSRRKKALAQRLEEFADDLDSPWIVVSSHGYKGVNRALFGSFAESLLRVAKRPVFFLPKAPTSAERLAPVAQRILFATDFSKSSHDAFQNFLQIFDGGSFEVRLFYANTFPEIEYLPPDQSLGETKLMLGDLTDIKHRAQAWIDQAAREGCRAQLSTSRFVHTSDVASAILKEANTYNASLLCLTSTSDQLSALIAGSVSRGVFRESGCSVLVFGPKTMAVHHQRILDESVIL